MQHAAEQLSCECNEGEWRTSEGVRIADGLIIDTLAPFSASANNQFFIYKGTPISVDLVILWKRNFNLLSFRFSEWCKSNACVCDLDELKAYFGDVSKMLDFKHHCLLWEPFFYSKCDCFNTDKKDYGSLLIDQLDFEQVVGLNRIGNPSLFPPRKEILEAIGGLYAAPPKPTESPLGKHTTPRKNRGRHAKNRLQPPTSADQVFIEQSLELSSKWEDDPAATIIINEMLDELCARYMADEYNPSEFFEWFCSQVEDWVMATVGLTQLYKDNKDLVARVANRIAALKFVGNEHNIIKAIGDVSSNPIQAPRKLSEERLTQLRSGTTWRP